MTMVLTIAVVYWSKGWWRWLWQPNYWSYKSYKAPVKSSPPTNRDAVFLHMDALPFAQLNSVKALKGIISHSMDLLTPNSPGVFQLCLWPLMAPVYLGGGLPCLLSAFWCQYPGHDDGADHLSEIVDPSFVLARAKERVVEVNLWANTVDKILSLLQWRKLLSWTETRAEWNVDFAIL